MFRFCFKININLRGVGEGGGRWNLPTFPRGIGLRIDSDESKTFRMSQNIGLESQKVKKFISLITRLLSQPKTKYETTKQPLSFYIYFLSLKSF